MNKEDEPTELRPRVASTNGDFDQGDRSFSTTGDGSFSTTGDGPFG